MMRFILTALFGILAVAAPIAADYPPPDWYRGYPAQQAAYPANPETLVRAWYRQYLGRDPDPSGLQSWVAALLQGNQPEAVLATILGSEEYLLRSGGTPEGFVQNLFKDLTGRRPSQAEFDYW